MVPARRLVLAKERLAELGPDALALVAAGVPPEPTPPQPISFPVVGCPTRRCAELVETCGC